MKEAKIPWWLRKKADQRHPPTPPDYTVISAAGMAVVKLLQGHMVPELIPSRDGISLCCPTEHGDIIVGIYLYDIRENEEVRMNGMQPVDEAYLQFPPMYLNLHYMITAYLDMDIRYRSEEQQRILGSIMQIIHDNPILDSDTMQPAKGAAPGDLRLEYENLQTEEKVKIWSSISMPYQLSLFYKLSPVKLESTIFTPVTRVKEVSVHLQEGASYRLED